MQWRIALPLRPRLFFSRRFDFRRQLGHVTGDFIQAHAAVAISVDGIEASVKQGHFALRFLSADFLVMVQIGAGEARGQLR